MAGEVHLEATTFSSGLAAGASWRLGYRPALDGLRAIAVLLVVAYHFHIRGFGNGGNTGVNIFFVLSGFLITTLLAQEHLDNGRINFRAFYERRIRRLLPALVLLLSAVLVASAVTGRLGRVIEPILYALFYVSNMVPRSHGQLGPLWHTWTLATEEQFYLVWPLALLALIGGVSAAPRVLHRRSAIPVAAASLGLLLAATGILPTGGLALLFGSWLGLMAVFARMPRCPTPLVILAALVVGWWATGRNPGDPTHGLLSIYPACGILVLAAASSSPAANVLTARPLVWIGRISYGIYLWHFAILWFVARPLVDTEMPWLLTRLILGAMALLFAYLSYRFVERRFLLRRQRARFDIPAPTSSREDDSLDAGRMLPREVGPVRG